MPSRPRWVAVLGSFALSRILIVVLGVAGVATFATIGSDGRTGEVVDNTSALNPATVWHKWDCLWYERIATHGYGYELDSPRGQAAGAFFPLYPLTVGALMKLAPSLSFFWTATLLSNVLTLAALLLLAGSLIDTDDLATRVMAVMMTSAGSFYLSIPYTESLFLLLVVGTMVATRRRQYELAGLLAGLSATTRMHGFAVVAIPAVACWLDTAMAPRARVSRATVTILAFAVPVAAYLAFLASVQGSPLAFMQQQKMWDNPAPWVPLQAVIGLIKAPTRINGWLHGGFWLFYVVLLIRYWRQLPLGEALFCAGVFVISAQQETFQGAYRYVMPLIPIALAVARDRDRVRHTVIGVNLAFAVLMILAFVTRNRLAV